MNWKDIAPHIAKISPVLGTMLGGPAGAAVGGLIAAALGTKDNTPQAVDAAIAADPQAALKLKELETNARLELQRLAVSAERARMDAAAAQFAAEAADRANARQLAAQQKSDWVRPMVTILLIAGAAAIVFFILTGRAAGLLNDATASLTVGTIIGYWFNELKQVMAFWFGTTGETQKANDEVRQFATSPGSVTIDNR